MVDALDYSVLFGEPLYVECHYSLLSPKVLFSVITFFSMLISWGDPEFVYWLGGAHLISSIHYLYSYSPKSSRKGGRKLGLFAPVQNSSFFEQLHLKPAQLVLVLFLVVIVVGSIFLVLPYSTKESVSMGWLNAFFISTSATCVTGLSPLNLADHLSFFGQMVILTLIQIGGLGIMTISSSMTIILGKSVARRDRIVMQELLDISSQEELRGLIIDIIRYTFWIELWGALILTFAFLSEGFEFREAVYYGFFHSISAFCNAGFSLFFRLLGVLLRGSLHLYAYCHSCDSRWSGVYRSQGGKDYYLEGEKTG